MLSLHRIQIPSSAVGHLVSEQGQTLPDVSLRQTSDQEDVAQTYLDLHIRKTFFLQVTFCTKK